MRRNLGILVAVGLAFATAARADVYGSDPTVNLGTLDTCVGCMFAYVDFPGTAAGQVVTSYSFYAGTTGLDITPLLFENTGGTDFKIIGIGTTQVPSTLGTNTFAFGLTSGTATVQDSNTYFGWIDGNTTGTANTGTITSNYNAGGGGFGNYYASPPGTIAVNDPFTFNTFTITAGQNTRTYSVNVTTATATTPEPGVYGIYGAFALGLIALVGITRRRKIA